MGPSPVIRRPKKNTKGGKTPAREQNAEKGGESKGRQKNRGFLKGKGGLKRDSKSASGGILPFPGDSPKDSSKQHKEGKMGKTKVIATKEDRPYINPT